MLTHIAIKNLAIIHNLELEFNDGLHIITGETGAGKSIIIDALSIVLGERISPQQVRNKQGQAEICANFDISTLPMVKKILVAQDLGVDECVIRRVINTDGRTRAYINGHNVALQQIRSIAPYLVHIHSQHQNHALLDSFYQRQLLDGYANHPELLQNVQTCYTEWNFLQQEIKQLEALQQKSDKLDLINYQVQELEALSLQENELQNLDQKHMQLAKGQEILDIFSSISSMLADDDNHNIIGKLNHIIQDITSIIKLAPYLANTLEMLQQATVLLEECSSNIDSHSNNLDLDPEQLATTEQRLSTIHALARKLKITPELLADHLIMLKAQQDELGTATERLANLEQELKETAVKYYLAAEQLHSSRVKAAKRLTKEVMQQLVNLDMPKAIFTIECNLLKDNNPNPHGLENIDFMIAANPGQPLGLLKKIASGGELSRVSLAIQAITAKKMSTPTIILDEVDVGISGKTAATVGSLIRSLGKSAQIICITHLPQVATYGDHHIKVEKLQKTDSTDTVIYYLNYKQRIEELARLVGGDSITPQAIAHAEEQLNAIHGLKDLA